MSFLKPFKTFWLVGTSYFTVITSLFALIFAASGMDGSADAAKFFDPAHVLLILMLSFIMALGSAIYRIDEINRPLATALHAIVYIAGFVFFFWAGGYDITRIAVGTLILSVVYVGATVIVRMVEHFFKKHKKPVSASDAAMSQNSNKAKKEHKASSSEISDTPKKSKKESKKKQKEEYKNLFS